MRSLTPERVRLIRTSGKPDSYFAALWLLTIGTIRDARTGRTWAHHGTPPDTTPRGPGRPFKRLKPDATDVARAMSAWGPPADEPSPDTSSGEHQ